VAEAPQHENLTCAGLVKLGAQVGISLLPPKEKITVLLIGNHSAGKSSFINWYGFICYCF
jgi:predicted GTPase